jgi:hypothetical protein
VNTSFFRYTTGTISNPAGGAAATTTGAITVAALSCHPTSNIRRYSRSTASAVSAWVSAGDSASVVRQ